LTWKGIKKIRDTIKYQPPHFLFFPFFRIREERERIKVHSTAARLGFRLELNEYEISMEVEYKLWF
jgi:hypothetical protein